jgi:hypothetical protein
MTFPNFPRHQAISKQIADAHFINEPVIRVCRPEPDAGVDYEVVAEFEISSGKDQMRLLVRGQRFLLNSVRRSRKSGLITLRIVSREICFSPS